MKVVTDPQRRTCPECFRVLQQRQPCRDLECHHCCRAWPESEFGERRWH